MDGLSLQRVPCRQPPSMDCCRPCAFCYPDQVKNTTVYQKWIKRGFRRTRNKALGFSYTDLINIAKELTWFPPKRMVVWGRRTNQPGFVHELRDLRNYVHSRRSCPLNS